nr:energy transducer TonB [Craterilacuibacter sp. RT1T]
MIKKTGVLLPLALSLLLHTLFVALLPAMQAQTTRPPLQLGLLALPRPSLGKPASVPASPAQAAPLPAKAMANHRPAPKTTTAKPLPAPPRPAGRPDLALPAPPAAPATAATAATTASPATAGTATGSSAPASAGAGALQTTDAGSASDAGFSSADWRAGSLDNPAPVYPERARARGEEGRVVLRVEVGADGRVRDISILHSSGFPRLDRAARDAVERWRFTPARRGNRAVADRVDVPIRFRQTDE